MAQTTIDYKPMACCHLEKSLECIENKPFVLDLIQMSVAAGHGISVTEMI